jgi:YidC/Oxa1 family membrane protein insertase
MNRNTAFNLVLFVVLAVAIFGGWWLIDTYFIPKPPAPTPPAPKEKKPARETLLAFTGGAVAGSSDLGEWPTAFKPEVPKEEPRASRETQLAAVAGGPIVPAFRGPGQLLIALSGEGYNLRVLVTNRGAGVQQVVIPAFDQASRLGTTAKDENGHPYPLELVPGYVRSRDKNSVKTDGEHHYLKPGVVGDDIPKDTPLTEPSYTLLHYDAQPTGDGAHPEKELATRRWDVVGERSVTHPDREVEGKEVAFETTLDSQHVRIRKTFTLYKDEFHVRLKLEFFATPDRPKDAKFYYQVSGPRNLPIEGEWYAGTQRNAVIGYSKGGKSFGRALQDAAHVVTEHGSVKYTPNSNDVPGTFTFAAVVNQFFAAALCIAPDQPDGTPQNLWEYVRATREGPEPDADKPQLGDITVRAVSKAVEPPADGKPVEHRYWLYHGPTKVRLLNKLDLLDKDHQGYAADPGVVAAYTDQIGLNVITDAPSPFWGWTSFIGWTWLVVSFTDLMHGILGWMHLVVPYWGVNILMLTVLVRLVLMLPSRRQQASMMKMQEKMAAMKPELDKLQERYKNDPQRLNQEKTRLMLQHGVNPLSSMGGCLLMFAQMPIFLGLYYCLQESVFFRLDNFLWIQNLAAPDMLFTWSESIPFISTPDQLGHTWYLGPFVNILPILAVSLMYLNFKVSSPPPTDEQQAAQQRTMKFMMIFMGVFFYKMAAGLCLYFICSTGWGLLERWLIKRKKKAAGDPLVLPPPASPNGPAKPTAPTAPPKPPGFMGRLKQGLMDKLEEAQRQAESKGQQIINDPQKKQPPGGNQGGGKGKKKRKK